MQQPTSVITNTAPVAAATTNDNPMLAQMFAQMQAMQNQMNQLANNNKATKTKKVATHYCWTHGYTITDKQTSKNCDKRAPGHQEEATMTNRMGGSANRKPTD